MKKIFLILALIFIGIKSFPQHTYVDTTTKTIINTTPATMEDGLYEIICFNQVGEERSCLIVPIIHCHQFERFKRDYPKFFIDKPMVDKYKRICVEENKIRQQSLKLINRNKRN